MGGRLAWMKVLVKNFEPIKGTKILSCGHGLKFFRPWEEPRTLKKLKLTLTLFGSTHPHQKNTMLLWCTFWGENCPLQVDRAHRVDVFIMSYWHYFNWKQCGYWLAWWPHGLVCTSPDPAVWVWVLVRDMGCVLGQDTTFTEVHKWVLVNLMPKVTRAAMH